MLAARSCGVCSSFPVDEAFEVERDVGEADLYLGPLDADRADEQAHAVFLCGKDVLDSRTYFGASGIGALALRRKWLSRCTAEVDFRYPPRAQDGPLVFLAAIGSIRPDRAAGVVRIDQVRQFPAIVAGGITGAPRPDEAVPLGAICSRTWAWRFRP